METTRLTAARYIENGSAKVAPCKCSTSSIHEKDGNLSGPHYWACRNCGEKTHRVVRTSRVVAGTGGALGFNDDGDLVIL